jgi:hypothetical protein
MKRLIITTWLMMVMVVMASASASSYDTLRYAAGEAITVELKADDAALAGGVVPDWNYSGGSLTGLTVQFGGREWIDWTATAGMTDFFVWYSYDVTSAAGTTVTHRDTIAFIHIYAVPALTGARLNGRSGDLYVKEGTAVELTVTAADELDLDSVGVICSDTVLFKSEYGDGSLLFAAIDAGSYEVRVVAWNGAGADTLDAVLLSLYPEFTVGDIGYTARKGTKTVSDTTAGDTIAADVQSGWSVSLDVETNGMTVGELSGWSEFMSFNWTRDGRSVWSGGASNGQSFDIQDFDETAAGLYCLHILAADTVIERWFELTVAHTTDAIDVPDGLMVWGTDGTIYISGNVGNVKTTIYSVTGALIWTGAGDAVVRLARGFYVVRVGNRTFRVINQ